MTLGRIIALAAAASLACAHAAAPSSAPTRYAAVDDARLLHAAEDPDDWLTYGGTYLEERFSRLDGINVDNVSRLRPAWYFEADTTRGQEATPIVVDGRDVRHHGMEQGVCTRCTHGPRALVL